MKCLRTFFRSIIVRPHEPTAAPYCRVHLAQHYKLLFTLLPTQLDVVFSFLSFSRPFFRLARLAKLAGHNAKDGLTSHGFMGFGNENTDIKNDIEDTSSLRTNAAATAAGRKWGNIIQVSFLAKRTRGSKGRVREAADLF